MALKRASDVLKDHGYVDVEFDSKAFQECINRIVEREYQKSQGDLLFWIQGCRMRNAPEHLKKLGFDEHEEYCKSHMGLETYSIRALQIDDQYLGNAVQLLKMYGYVVGWVNHNNAYYVRLS